MSTKNKSLSEKLGARKLNGRAQFLAQIDDIKVAFEDGFDGKSIWSELKTEKKITISYPVFMTYASELIKNKKTVSSVQLKSNKKSPESKPEKTAVKVAVGTDTQASTEQKLDNSNGGPKRGESFDFNEVVRPEAGHNVSDDELF